MKTFKDLEFVYCIWNPDATMSTMDFENGYGVRVVLGSDFYSNGVDTYELAVTKEGHLCYDTPITDDVLGYLTEEEVTKIMEQVQNLK